MRTEFGPSHQICLSVSNTLAALTALLLLFSHSLFLSFPSPFLHFFFVAQSTGSFFNRIRMKENSEKSGLHFTGFDPDSEVRAFELPKHPFFIGVLFQPERSALQGKQHPLIQAFVEATLKI